ncbi:protein MODIFYING WALL LIGNIN-2-like [Amaranthus tricolor]|uniref:protein MODIFYING WALL LIGNIN-2-like n=1 Tax=Amaranthus tricolor TaxID=29722 RepID=UPI002587D0C9|nr:protein MODIFYING WALL LIGNIN-2-like [Amaranthus tricolor]
MACVSDIGVTSFGTCEYPTTHANILGYKAAILALVAQVIISTVTRCACCQRSSSNNISAGATLNFVLSWVASVIGIGLLIAAANLSSRQEFLDGSGLCYTVKPRVFAAGGCLALLASILGLWSYNSSTKQIPQNPGVAAPYQSQGGIAMGNPLFATPPENTCPKQQQYQYV